MAEDLSQDEIDALISGAKETDELSEEVQSDNQRPEKEKKAKQKVKNYNFKKPCPIPEEQKKTIALLHEQYAQKLKINLSAFLRTETETSLEGVEQVTFAEYISSLNSPTTITSFDMHPLSGFGLIEVNAVIAYSIIDRMLGGKGSVPSQVRPFTDVEIAIIRKFVDTLLENLQEAWKPIIKMTFSPKTIQTNPSMIRIIPMREITLIVTLNVKIANTNGLITICIPYSNLEPIAFKLGNQQWNKYTGKKSESIQAAQRKNFYRINLELSAILGTIDLNIEDVLSLQVGDIIDLGKKTKSPIKIQVAKKEKFEASPGLLGKYKAISIQNDIKKE